MPTWIRILAPVLAFYLCVASLHAWLNIGLHRFGIRNAWAPAENFRVGFLPVT